jgi:hypothetical protein
MKEKKTSVLVVTAVCDCGTDMVDYCHYSNEGTDRGLFCPQCKKFEKTDTKYPYFEVVQKHPTAPIEDVRGDTWDPPFSH